MITYHCHKSSSNKIVFKKFAQPSPFRKDVDPVFETFKVEDCTPKVTESDVDNLFYMFTIYTDSE